MFCENNELFVGFVPGQGRNVCKRYLQEESDIGSRCDDLLLQGQGQKDIPRSSPGTRFDRRPVSDGARGDKSCRQDAEKGVLLLMAPVMPAKQKRKVNDRLKRPMKIAQILTSRDQSNGKDYGIVNEWEDVFSAVLKVPLYHDNWKRRDKTVFWKLPWLASCFQTNVPTFAYVMLPLASPPGNNKSNIIPCMIDFFCRDEGELQRFYKKYDRNPLVLISSKEAYNYLVSVKCPLNIRHLALSIPDRYRLGESRTVAKRYDVVMLGRQNKVLKSFLERYKQNHPDLTYVSGVEEGNRFLYRDSNGDVLGYLDSRAEYMDLMSKSRIGLYATPGMDGGQDRTNGFNPVTPRFLEYIVSGCHVIARYPTNSDTDYYELERMTARAETFEQFEKAMDELCHKEVNVQDYSQYLDSHYTSVRARTLLKYLEEV